MINSRFSPATENAMKHVSWFEFGLPANYVGLCPLFCVRAKVCLLFIFAKSIFAKRFA